MTTITTRAGLGSPLSNDQVDANFTNLNDDKVEASGDSMTGDLSFGDNNKAIFGAGSDLQIYHDGSNSFIRDSGTGDLQIRASNLLLTDVDGTIMLDGRDNGKVSLHHNGSEKITTTSTGIDVTGTALAHEIEIGDGSGGGTSEILFSDNVSARGKILYDHSSNPETMLLQTTGTTAISIDNSQNVSMPNGNLDVTGSVTADGLTVGSTGVLTLGEEAVTSGYLNAPESLYVNIDSNNNDVSSKFQIGTNATGIATDVKFTVVDNGDISFYNSAGTSQDFYWDASTSRLGIGNSSPATTLDVTGTVTADGATIDGAVTVNGAGINLDDAYSLTWGDGSAQVRGSGSSEAIDLRTASTTRLNIDADGDVSLYNSAGTSQDLFWDASASRLGLGVTDPESNLHIDNSSGGILTLSDRSASTDGDKIGGIATKTASGTFYAGINFFYHDSDDGEIRFRTKVANTNTDVMTIVDGNVGIGTASPANKLTVSESSADFAALIQNSLTSGNGLKIQAGDNSGDRILQLDDKDGNERLRVTAVGNVGIGTQSPLYELHIEDASGNAVVNIESSTTGYSAVNLGDTNNDDVGQIKYDNSTNSMQFTTNATEAVRIDSSGNLLVGTNTTAAGNEGMVYFNGSSLRVTRDSDEPLNLDRLTSDGTIAAFKKDGTTVGSIGSVAGARAYFATNNVGISPYNNIIYPTNQTGATTDGSADLGASSSRFKSLYLSGNVLANKARIGTTNTLFSASEFASIDGSSSLALGLVNNASGNATLYVKNLHNDGTSNNRTLVFFQANSGNRGSITSDGASVSYNTTSDQRLKDNIVDAPSASDDIDAIQVRSFDWKANGSHQKYGMVAQELQTVAPEAVTGDADSDEMMAVDYSKLVPMLVKEIQSLRARVAQLEGAN